MANPVPYNQLFDIDGLNAAIRECEGTADEFSAAVTEDFKRINNSVQAIKKSIEALNASMGSRTIKLVDETSQQAIVDYAKQVVDLTKQVRDQQTAISSLNEIINANKVAVSDAKVAAEQYKVEQQNLKAQQEATKLSIQQQTLFLEQQKQALTDVKLATQQSVQAQQQNKTAVSAANLANQQYITTVKQQQAAQASLNMQIAQNRLQISNLALANKQAAQAQTAATGSYNEAVARLKAMGIAIKEAKDGFTSTDPVIQQQIRDYNALNNQIKTFDAQMGNAQRNVGNYKSALSGVTDQLKTLALSYFSVMAIFAEIKRVITTNAEVSDSMADVRRTAALTATEIENLAEQLKKIDTRTSLKGLLDIAVIGGQLGIAKDQLAGFTKAVDQLAVTLSGEIKGGAEAVASSLGKINGVFEVQKKEGTDVERAFNKTGSAILALGQAGLATGEFIQDFSLRVAGTAQIAKLSLPVILAYSAVLEETGSSAEVAGTAFNRLVGNLAAKRQEFFTIAKIADSTLTIEKFTHLINTDANAALQKFFAGLNAGGKDLTSFTDLINVIGLRAGPAKNAIIALAQNQSLLNERIRESVTAYNEGSLSAEQFAIKNNNLAGSVDKLSNSFVKLTTSGKVADFFQSLIDKATHLLDIWRDFDKVKGPIMPTQSIFRSSGEDKRAAANTINDSFAKSRSEFSSVTDPFSQDPKILTANLGVLTQAYKDAYHAYSVYYDGIKSGKVKESRENGQTLADFKANAEDILQVFKNVQQRYDAIPKEIIKDTTVKQLGDEELTSIKQIRDRITELSKLPGSATPGSDIANRIEDLKRRLHELAPSYKQAKDGFQVLEEQIKKTMLALQDNIIQDYGKHQGKESENTKKLADAYQVLTEKLIALQKLRDDAIAKVKQQRQIDALGSLFPLNTKPDAAPDTSLTNDPRNRHSLGNDLQVGQNSIDIAEIDKQLDDVAKAYSESNKAIIDNYKNRNLTKAQMNAQLLANESDQADKEYFLNSNSLAKQLENARLINGDTSKEYRALLVKKAKLDEQYSKEGIKNLKDTEETKRRIIEETITVLEKSASVLSSVTGNAGLGKLFSDFSKDAVQGIGKAEQFQATAQIAIDATSAYTDFAINASKARQAALETEMQYEIDGAGTNADAKKKIEAEYTKKINAEKTKQAKAAKAAAEIEIIVNTAVAASKVFGQTGIFGIGLAPIIIGLGLAELAIVAATDIPQFEKGRTSGPATVALVNEKGPELLVKDGKGRFANKGKKGYTFLRENEQVFRADETAKYVNSQLDNSVQVSKSKPIYDTWVSSHSGSRDIDYDRLGRSVGDAVGKLPLQENNWNDKGYQRYTRTSNSRIKSVRDRNKL